MHVIREREFLPGWGVYPYSCSTPLFFFLAFKERKRQASARRIKK